MRQFILPASLRRDNAIERIATVLATLPQEHAWRVEVKEHKPVRSHPQNKYLWGVCYAELLKVLPGWDADDVHEYMLGEFSGWETIEGLGKKRLRPLERSSRMNKQRFSDFIAFVQRKAAEHGVFVPEPDDE